MVSKKRLGYGFSGYRGPVIPRAPRSIRKRGPHKKLVEDSQLCAFELLAAVAGKLLLESESSASSNVAEAKSQLGSSRDRNEKRQPRDDKALKSESFDHGSCAESAFVPKVSVEDRNLFNKGIPQAENDQVVEQTAVHVSSDFQQKLDCDIKLGISEEKSLDENATCKIESSNFIGESLNSKVESGSEVQSQDDKNRIGHLSMANTSTVNDSIGEYVNTNVLSNPESSVKFPLYRDSKPDALLKKCYNNVKVGTRDDDENSFRCNKSSTKSRPLRPQPSILRHRMRKMMTSKYWRATPKLMDYELYSTSEGMKTFYRYRKSMHARERCEQAPLKKRKLSDRSFSVAIDQEQSSDSIFNLPEKASGASIKGHAKAKDPNVTFSIKSFKVPELYIDVPETATVGSLKRTVVDAVAAILGGGIRVGVIYQGKKVRDDQRTLQQAGISQCANPDNLGFILEPSFTHVSPSETPKKPTVLFPCADRPSPRSPISPMTHSGVSNASLDPPLVTKSDNVDNNEYILSPTTPDNKLTDGAVINSKALIPAPAPPMNVEPLAAIPANLKHKRSEMSQRRTRRPFSVTEVEALVEAVETLGTGRWRDVKMRAFEDADHRTYVDLKDKWKTLVHTASISPQQRRGEPVPHELLDRVLSAHSYWSQHQSRQHGKHPADPLNVDSREGILGA
ncbi:telomere repeat-binding protein 3-like [Salvia splendens]|uniref:telomere repeat-binding protein 3-like n=1 Tax=Salvia splendens TaxID=180675 RepID=UPI001C25C95A|nr:telomere repeat-binding protein 3-like [Salvia splendens]